VPVAFEVFREDAADDFLVFAVVEGNACHVAKITRFEDFRI
jgi:hypothetical protein